MSIITRRLRALLIGSNRPPTAQAPRSKHKHLTGLWRSPRARRSTRRPEAPEAKAPPGGGASPSKGKITMNQLHARIEVEDATNAAGALDALALAYRERARQCRDGKCPYEHGPAWDAEADRLEAMRDRLRAA